MQLRPAVLALLLAASGIAQANDELIVYELPTKWICRPEGDIPSHRTEYLSFHVTVDYESGAGTVAWADMPVTPTSKVVTMVHHSINWVWKWGQDEFNFAIHAWYDFSPMGSFYSLEDGGFASMRGFRCRAVECKVCKHKKRSSATIVRADRYCESVTESGNEGHPAAFPLALPDWFIQLFADEVERPDIDSACRE